MSLKFIASGLVWLGLARSVVILPGGEPKTYTPTVTASSADDLLKQSAANEFFNNTAKIIISSYTVNNQTSAADHVPSGESFVRGVVEAWGSHLHLVIRPEEVWFTILAQMNFYMNSHAEDIRHLFVDFDGKETIQVEDVTLYKVLRGFQYAIQQHVKTDWLLDWIQPNFTTTTENDMMTANILMMGLTKAYFNFEAHVICGLPSVTLLGEEADWEALLKKLDRLDQFGDEPKDYARQLRPIIKRMVRSFREPDSQEIRDFWNTAVSGRISYICGAPPMWVSGWITGFLHWTTEGKVLANPNNFDSHLTLDNVSYATMDISVLPVGYAATPLTMIDFGGMDRFPAAVAAGTLGKRISSGPPAGYVDALKRAGANAKALALAANASAHVTLQPLSAWMMYGPVDLNATAQNQWQREREMTDIAREARKYFVDSPDADGMTCGVSVNETFSL